MRRLELLPNLGILVMIAANNEAVASAKHTQKLSTNFITVRKIKDPDEDNAFISELVNYCIANAVYHGGTAGRVWSDMNQHLNVVAVWSYFATSTFYRPL